ncbi:hypothetical protein Verru16b_03034 [Lacunisphaera limnophila]|uniref:Uncharacterized protein n=1 Tax=Lacunisphaera limnophila TaxID=1838286 RepID=A0A1D8AYG2_9BACT|nr:hypothetical protein [Lacunisphaera limnophila]AOS45943.1 hypothetical protein Verru16b_03034 [Lacunisphaera limnophila]
MKWTLIGMGVLLGAGRVAAADPAAEPPPAAAEAEADPADALYELGQGLFEALAPEEIKAEYEFPDRARWDAFVQSLQAALAGNDPAALVALEPEARAALVILRQLAGTEDDVDWLEERLDYIEAAQEMVRQPPPKPPVKPRPARGCSSSRSTSIGCGACRPGPGRPGRITS